jgi:uncharacterized glyoxalase superfamily protein PhnB
VAVHLQTEDAGEGRVAVLRDPFGHRWFLNDESP